MAIRPEEEFCQKAFSDYLHGPQQIHGEVWEPEPNGSKTAPDFHLRHGGLTHAVEVTALMTQYEQAEGGPVSELGIWMTTERLADEVEKQAIEQGLLNGAYVLTLDGPYDFFHASKKEIKER